MPRTEAGRSERGARGMVGGGWGDRTGPTIVNTEIWRGRARLPYTLRMRLRRILVVLGVAGAPLVVTSIGCNVDNSRYPGLPNELPNIPGIPIQIITHDGGGGDGGDGGDGSVTTSPAMNV